MKFMILGLLLSSSAFAADTCNYTPIGGKFVVTGAVKQEAELEAFKQCTILRDQTKSMGYCQTACSYSGSDEIYSCSAQLLECNQY